MVYLTTALYHRTRLWSAKKGIFKRRDEQREKEPHNEIKEEQHYEIEKEQHNVKLSPSTVDASTSLDTSSNEKHQDRNHGERSSFSLFIDQQEKKCPRFFNIFFTIIVPLILLTFLAMLCGHFLAKLERKEELKHNNNVLATKFREYHQTSATDQCLDTFVRNATSEIVNSTKLMNFVRECKSNDVIPTNLTITHYREYISIKNVSLSDGMHYFWNICTESGSKGSREDYETEYQSTFIFTHWLESFESLASEYISDGASKEEASTRAIQNASGTDACVINSAGGSMFWFTIMTTIGYGNIAPVTKGGRSLVFTMGFFSILAFTAVIGKAAYVLLSIVEDVFIRVHMPQVTDGWTSVAIWLFITFLWMLVIGESYLEYCERRGYDDYSQYDTFDAFWFGFNSVTTVGLGDFYIEHTNFRQTDMFYIPFGILLGLVFMSNFLIKFSETMIAIINKTEILDDESLHFLLQEDRRSTYRTDGMSNGRGPEIEVPLRG